MVSLAVNIFSAWYVTEFVCVFVKVKNCSVLSSLFLQRRTCPLYAVMVEDNLRTPEDAS